MRYPCPPGFYCPAGVNDKLNCLSGTYQFLSNKGTCTDCPARFFCSKDDGNNAEILIAGTVCTAGHYCPKRTINPIPCPAGTYSTQGGLSLESECEECPPGNYCTGGGSAPTAQCQAGYYCTDGASIVNPTDSTTGNICPVGHYCPLGSYEPTKCPKGTLNDNQGDAAIGDCELCPAGFFCPYLAATSAIIDTSSSTHKCDVGYLCLAGAFKSYGTDGVRARACVAGNSCEKGATSETPCSVGTYNPLSASGSCYACPAGLACNTSGMIAPVDCPVGHYCSIGTSGVDNSIPCPAGTFSNDINLKQVTECAPCPPGKFCTSGTTDPSSNDCTAGYYCVIGSVETAPTTFTYTIGSELNGKCPSGYYCETGTISPTPCPKGKYNPSESGTSVADCLDCPAGKYCDEMGIDVSTIVSKDCTQGFWCIGGSTTPTPTDNTMGKICSPGKYCAEGTTTEVDCLAGSYEPRQGNYLVACQTCPAGSFCIAGSSFPVDCPFLSYCPEGSAAALLCPDGTYNNNLTHLETFDQCKECPTGKYCTGGEIQGRCDAGYQCDYGATAAADPNKLCPIGFYCPVYTDSQCAVVDPSICGLCAGDATCIEDFCCLFPIRCGENLIRETAGAAVAGDCAVCPNGYYCLSGSNTKVICPRGFYCEPGSATKVTPCPEGTSNPSEGMFASTDCTTCGVGYLCNKAGIADKDNFLCPLGWYCDQAQTTDTSKLECPAGTYRDTIGAAAIGDCHQCPAGYHCVINTITPTPCTGGKHLTIYIILIFIFRSLLPSRIRCRN
jgi:hypothetical protein